MPQPSKRSLPYLGWSLAALGVLVVIAIFLPWFHVVLPPGDGVPSIRIGDARGTAFVGVLGGVTVVMGVLIGLGQGHAWTTIVALVSNGLVPFFVLLDMAGQRLNGAFDLPDAPHYTVAYGYWLTLIIGIVGLAVSIVALSTRQPVARRSEPG